MGPEDSTCEHFRAQTRTGTAQKKFSPHKVSKKKEKAYILPEKIQGILKLHQANYLKTTEEGAQAQKKHGEKWKKSQANNLPQEGKIPASYVRLVQRTFYCQA